MTGFVRSFHRQWPTGSQTFRVWSGRKNWNTGFFIRLGGPWAVAKHSYHVANTDWQFPIDSLTELAIHEGITQKSFYRLLFRISNVSSEPLSILMKGCAEWGGARTDGGRGRMEGSGVDTHHWASQNVCEVPADSTRHCWLRIILQPNKMCRHSWEFFGSSEVWSNSSNRELHWVKKKMITPKGLHTEWFLL